MRTLQRKLWRTILSTKWPFLALVAVVAVGMTTFYGLNNTLINIEQSKKLYYRQTGFADYYFELTGAPAAICRHIGTLAGVAQVSGRLDMDVKVLKGNQGITTGRITGYSLPMPDNLNRLYVTKGDLFSTWRSTIPEALIDKRFAVSNGFHPGGVMSVLAKDHWQELKIAGIATSPEFSSIQKGEIYEYVGDSFGIIMLSSDDAGRIMGMPGVINRIMVNFTPGSREAVVAGQIENMLRPYGLQKSYPRREHHAEKSLQEKLDGLKTSTYILPSIFFLVGLTFLYIQLGQLVKNQRTQIGIMKALGYHNEALILLYLGYALAIALAGTLIGFVAGTWLSSFVLGIYNSALGIPVRVDRINPVIVAGGAAMFSLSALLSCLLVARKIVGICPAEAIRPAPPSSNVKVFLENYPPLWQRLSGGWKMSLRVIQRNRIRFAVTSFGIAASIALLVIGRSFLDSKDYLLDQFYHRQNEFSHTIRFSSPVKSADMASWLEWPGINRLEPALQLAGNLSKPDNPVTVSEIITGVAETSLKGPLNDQGKRVNPPGEGIIVSQRVAERLKLQPGDSVIVTFPENSKLKSGACLKVTGICPQYVGSESFMSLSQANRLAGEKDAINLAFVRVDKGGEPLIREKLKKVSKALSFISADLQEGQANNSVSGMVYFALIITGLAIIMGFALIFNTSVINFSERVKEIATLRVVGHTRSRISLLFLNELGLALICGAVVGLPAGITLARIYIRTVNTEFFHYTPVTTVVTLSSSVLAALLFALTGHSVAMRRLARLDLVETLKEKN